MKFLITYDIIGNKVRNRIVGKLQDYRLIRIQKSVFLGELEECDFKSIEKYSKEIIDINTDSIYFCRLCEKDFSNIDYFGKLINRALINDEVIFF